MDLWLLIPIGVAAGAITTFAGVGGGMMMTIVLAALVGPQTALAMVAPALLLGNLHRVITHRTELNRRVALVGIVGAAPGGLVGGLLAVSLSDAVLNVLLFGVIVLALLREVGVFSWRPTARALLPITFVAGVVTGTSGGGGLVLGPALLAAGLRGGRFVATSSAIALGVHVSRLAAYGAGGLVNSDTMTSSLALAVTIVIGNAIGKRLRVATPGALQTKITYGVLITGVALTVAGLR